MKSKLLLTVLIVTLTYTSTMQGTAPSTFGPTLSSNSHNTAIAQQRFFENAIRHQLLRSPLSPSTRLIAFGSYCDSAMSIAQTSCGSDGIASFSCTETSGTTGSYSFTCKSGGGGPAPLQS